MSSLIINANLSIPISEFHITSIRASGPGGQHVNKASTAIQVRFDVHRSPSLSEDVRKRLVTIAGNRITTDGEIIVTAQRFRSSKQNRADALERLARLIHRATVVPKKRRATRPSSASRRRRLDDKKKRGQLKKLRGHPGEN